VSAFCGCVIEIDILAFLLFVHITVLAQFVDERLICAPDTVFRSTVADIRSDGVQRDPQSIRQDC